MYIFLKNLFEIQGKVTKVKEILGESQKISDNHGNTSQLHKLLYRENSKVIKNAIQAWQIKYFKLLL